MIPVHASKTSDEVVRFATSLKRDVSPRYYKKIVDAYEGGYLWGLYLTKTGKIRATFIK